MKKLEKLYKKILSDVIRLNEFEGINVYLCIQGNTQVIGVTVEENKSMVYTRKEFLHNKAKIKQLSKDVRRMIEYKEKHTWKNRTYTATM